MATGKMRNIGNKFGFMMMWGCALFTALMVVVILVFLLQHTKIFFEKYSVFEFLFDNQWKPSANRYGIASFVVGSTVTTILSLGIALPLGVLSCWFIFYYLPERIRRYVLFIINVTASVPSIVFGLWGLSVLVPVGRVFGGSGFSVIITAVLLATMILPTVIALYGSELESIPSEYYACAVSLGESRERSIVKCIFPYSSYGVFSAGILALGRAVGETMAVLMVAGNKVKIPSSLNDGVRTLTTNISLEMGYATDMHRSALIACGLVLLVIILLLEVLIFITKRKFVNEK